MFMNIHPDLVTENKGHSSNIVSMLDHRRRRWPNIFTALIYTSQHPSDRDNTGCNIYTLLIMIHSSVVIIDPTPRLRLLITSAWI